MAAAPPQSDTEIIIGRGIPPEADIVFVATNADGKSGGLSSNVPMQTSAGKFELSSDDLTPGYAISQHSGHPVIVAIVTYAPDQNSNELLNINLRTALKEIIAQSVDRSIWMPLEGSNSGDLSAGNCLKTTLSAIRDTDFLYEGQPAQIALSASNEFDDTMMLRLIEQAREEFGNRLKVLDQKADDYTKTTTAVDTLPSDVDIPPIEVELTDDLVRHIQQTLAEQGYNVFADGMMGPATRAAIREYQSGNALEANGIVTLDLLDALGVSGPQTTVLPNDEPAPSEGNNPYDPIDNPKPDDQPPPDETAPFYPDHPTREDALGREAIAEAIATIVRDAWSDSDARTGENIDRTFMVHIHGRWGSGKSSILNFLRDILRPNARAALDDAGDDAAGAKAAESRLRRLWRDARLLLRDLPQMFGRKRAIPAAPDDNSDGDWIVVDYNAWRSQGHGPAWWSLLNRVHTEAYDQLGGYADATARRLRRQDILWRLRSGWTPYALAAAGLILIILLFTAFTGIALKEGLAAAGSVLAVTVGIFTFGKTYRIGSARTASTLLELSRDPLRPLIHRYNDMIDEIDRPVAVFIDDLDRCDAGFVVELLQSVQTLYRHAHVLYVVAADRDWICCSYEQVYDKFGDTIGEAGRPLGHLFLEKIFQLSISVPNISGPARDEYWKRLVAGTPAASEAEAEAIREQEKAAIGQLDTEADIRKYTAEIQGDPVRRRIAGAQAFSRLQSARLRTEREHFLTRYATLIEPNPRAMKRLVNAYGFKRGFELMSGSATDADALVRWTVLELRWPMLAAHLARCPDDIAMAADDAQKSGDETVALLAETPVRRVVSGLLPKAVRNLVGDGAVEEDNTPTAA